MTFVLQRVDGPRHIVCRQRRAVVKSRLRPKVESISQTVVGDADAARSEAVHGIRLVARAYHQRREGIAQAKRALAFEDVAVERCEGQKRPVVAARGNDL